MNFSEKLKSARIAAGLTQQELAKAVGLKGKQGVNNWESGFSRPNIEKLNLLAKALNVSVDFLASDSSLDAPLPIENMDEKRFTLRMDGDLFEIIKEFAAKDKRSVAKQIEFMLSEHYKSILEDENKKQTD